MNSLGVNKYNVWYLAAIFIVALLGCQSSTSTQTSNNSVPSSTSGSPSSTPAANSLIPSDVSGTYSNLQSSEQSYNSLKSSMTSNASTLSSIPGAPTNLPSIPTLPSIPGGGAMSSMPSVPGLSPGGMGSGKYGSFTDNMFGRIITFTYVAQPQANQNDSILLELAVNYDNSNTGPLSQIVIQDWFNLNNGAAQVYKQTDKVVIYRWQIVPDDGYEMTLLHTGSHAVDAYLFARYSSTMTSYPVKIDPYKNVLIILQPDTFGLTQFSPGDK
jgi:hypothetical protein